MSVSSSQLLAVSVAQTGTAGALGFFSSRYYTTPIFPCKYRIPPLFPGSLSASGGNSHIIYERLVDLSREMEYHTLRNLNLISML
jgi:hypothetical protein